MAKILIVDDEETIREGLREYCEFEGHKVTTCDDGFEAVSLCKNQDFDLVIMDVMMPKLDGFSAVKKIKETKDIKILMLSAKSEEYDKLFAFEIGVDDYVVKPFSPKEVMARVKAILKRKSEIKHQIFKFDGLVINETSRTVEVDGNRVQLTTKEFDLLNYLTKNKNIALSREKLLSCVWGYDFFGEDRTIDTHINLVRNAIGRFGKNIVTIRGFGYKFED